MLYSAWKIIGKRELYKSHTLLLLLHPVVSLWTLTVTFTGCIWKIYSKIKDVINWQTVKASFLWNRMEAFSNWETVETDSYRVCGSWFLLRNRRSCFLLRDSENLFSKYKISLKVKLKLLLQTIIYMTTIMLHHL